MTTILFRGVDDRQDRWEESVVFTPAQAAALYDALWDVLHRSGMPWPAPTGRLCPAD